MKLTASLFFLVLIFGTSCDRLEWKDTKKLYEHEEHEEHGSHDAHAAGDHDQHGESEHPKADHGAETE